MSWKICGALLGLILAIGGAYWFGRGDGQAIEQAKQAAVERAVAEERKKREDLVDQVGAGAAQAETARSTTTREITHEIQQIAVDRPVYRNRCIDADGVHLLDALADVANSEDPGVAAAEAGAAPEGPPAP